MYKFILFLLVSFPFLQAQAQIDKRKPPTSSKATKVWRLLGGYPKMHDDSQDCKSPAIVDPQAGTVTFKGYSNRKNREITLKIKFSPFPKELPYDEKPEFFVDANDNIHDAYQEVDLLVQIKVSPTNKAETVFNWGDFLGMSCGENQYNQDVKYVEKRNLNMANEHEYFLFVLKVATMNYVTGLKTYCNTFVFKYEKVEITKDEVVDCNYSPPVKSCAKSYFLRGVSREGNTTISKVTGTKFFREWCPIEKEDRIFFDSTMTYRGWNYTRIGEPSPRQDCAGFVFEKLWGIRNSWLTGQNFYDNIIMPFGRNLGNLRNGAITDLRSGDIVAYIKDDKVSGHIAYISNVEKNPDGTVTRITIQTKNTHEAVYTTQFIPGLVNWNDPLMQQFGMPTFFRINTGEIEVTEQKYGDCD